MSQVIQTYPFLFGPFEELEQRIDLSSLQCLQCEVVRDEYGEPRFYIYVDVEGALWTWCHTCLYEREPMNITVPGLFPDGSLLVFVADVDSTTVYDRRRTEWSRT
jgi:hypothetical protein